MELKIRIPEQVNTILEKLHASGHEAYVVGGCVRDALLGREPNDWDITTSALPTQVKEIFPRTIDTGLKHGTVTVLIGRGSYEVTTYRVDGVYEDGRHPKQVTFTPSLSEDLMRRDFTINAMAYDPVSGLVDLFDGQKDLTDGIIRAVGDPAQRFAEDALRILRAFRFAAQLGYEIDPETLRAASALSGSLVKISSERIREELEKILLSENPDILMKAYEAGVTSVFLPEFDVCMETPQNNPHHCYNVGEHSIWSTALIRRDRILRLTMLLHDFGKPVTRTTDERGLDHFRSHPEESYKIAKTILQRLKYDNETIRKVTTLVRYHDLRMRLTEPAVRKAIVRIGADLFPYYLEIQHADTMAQSLYQRDEKLAYTADLRRMYDKIMFRGDCLSLKDLAVNGTDLIAAGVKPGREIGNTLAQMLEDVLEVPQHNDKRYLMGRYVDGANT